MAGKSVLKSTPIGGFVDQLIQVWCELKKANQSECDSCVERLRAVTGKMLQVISLQEICRKEMVTKYGHSLPVLLDVLEFSSIADVQTSVHVSKMISDLISSAKHADAILACGLLQTVLMSVCNTVPPLSTPLKECVSFEDLVISLHILLVKVANKEKQVCTHARVLGAVDASLQVCSAFSSNARVLQPVLQVIKIFASSSANCSLFIKGGLVTVLMKILPASGQKRTSVTRLALDILCALVKSKVGAKRAVTSGIVPVLLSLHQEWHRVDIRNRQLALRKSILLLLKGCVMYAAGRKAFLAADGYRILYSLGLEGLESRELEPITGLAIVILRKCSGNLRLPLHSLKCAFSCPLDTLASGLQLASDFTSESGADGSDAGEKFARDSDVEDLCEDLAAIDVLPTEKLLTSFSPGHCTSPLSRADLRLYEPFLVELQELLSVEGDSTDPFSEAPRIRIPTVTCEQEGPFSPDLDELCSDDKPIRSCKCGMPCLSSAESGSNDAGGYLRRCQGAMSEEEEYSDFEIPLLRGERPLFNEVEATTSSASLPSRRNAVLLHRKAPDEAVFSDFNPTVNSLVSSCLFGDPPNTSRSEHVRSLLSFIKRAEPEVFGHHSPLEMDPLLEKPPELQRAMIFQDFARLIFTDEVVERVVYDLDALVCEGDSKPTSGESSQSASPTKSMEQLRSPVKRQASTSHLNGLKRKQILESDPLHFESRFECGNLRKAIQVRRYEYDLILNADVNSQCHHQWFYFQVQGMESGLEYRFNIISNEKPNSQFNFGMQPVLYSVRECERGNAAWRRVGTNVCYYRNYYTRKRFPSTPNKPYYTTAISLVFPHSNDTCYLAYHYPYSFSMLLSHLRILESTVSPSVYFKRQALCATIGGNDVPLLTITNRAGETYGVHKRPYVVLTSRVHPGESCSSWVMKGVMEFLVSDAAHQLRDVFIFKLVPCLNPDGVINGCNRLSLSGQDLNRQWLDPDPKLHPEIYHLKRLMQCMIFSGRPPVVFVDIHGHSRKKNVFMYGCSKLTAARKEAASSKNVTIGLPETTTGLADQKLCNPEFHRAASCEEQTVMALPRILSRISPSFSLSNCSFAVERSKQGTGRVVCYKELGITRSYTMESTYCGFDEGHCKGKQIGTRELEEMGRSLCLGLCELARTSSFGSRDQPGELRSSETS